MSEGTEDWTVGMIASVIRAIPRSLAEYSCDLPETANFRFTYSGQKVTVRIEIEEDTNE